MYRDYWGLSQAPFNEAHIPAMFVETEQVRLIRAKVEYLNGRGQCAAALCGAAGLGKSAVAWDLLRDFARRGFSTSYIVNPMGEARDILGTIAHDLGGVGDNPPEAVVAALETLQKSGKRACVVVDEAHAVQSMGILEAMRLLLNVEIHGELPLTLLLVGQPPLRKMLRRASSFDQRLSFLIDMAPMSPDETKQYILARLKAAHCERGIFTKSAAERIVEASGGVPRQVNRICDLALLAGYGLKQDKIRPELVDDVVQSLSVKSDSEDAEPDSVVQAPVAMQAVAPVVMPAAPAVEPAAALAPVPEPKAEPAWDIMAELAGTDAPERVTDVLAELSAGSAGVASAGAAEDQAASRGVSPMEDALAAIAPPAPVPAATEKALAAPAPLPIPPKAAPVAAKAAPVHSAAPAVAPATPPSRIQPPKQESAAAVLPVAAVAASLPHHDDEALDDLSDGDTMSDDDLTGPTAPAPARAVHRTLHPDDLDPEPTEDPEPEAMTPPEADILPPQARASAAPVITGAPSDEVLTKALFGGLDVDELETPSQAFGGDDDLAALLGGGPKNKKGSDAGDKDIEDVLKQLGL